MKILSECLGLIGIILNVIIYQQKKRKNLLIWKLISNVDWALHYAIAGNFSGAAVGTIGIARESTFLAIEGKKIDRRPFLALFLSVPASRRGSPGRAGPASCRLPPPCCLSSASGSKIPSFPGFWRCPSAHAC